MRVRSVIHVTAGTAGQGYRRAQPRELRRHALVTESESTRPDNARSQMHMQTGFELRDAS